MQVRSNWPAMQLSCGSMISGSWLMMQRTFWVSLQQMQTDERKLEQQVKWLRPKLLSPETEDKNRAHLLEIWTLSVHVLINSGGIKIQNFVKSVNC